MVRHRTIRRSVWVAVAAALAIPGAGVEAKAKVELAPNLKDYHVSKVAILGLANTTGEEDAEKILTYVVTALTSTGFYYITTAEDFAKDAKRTGVQADYSRMLSTWLKKRKADELVVQKVLKATGFDGVVALEVSRWEETTIDPLQEGTSDSSVGLLVQMFAADGTLLWSAKESVTRHSPPYLPQYNTRGTTSGQAVTTAKGAVPDPPEIEEIAQELAQTLIATLPDLKQKQPGGDPGKSKPASSDSSGSSH